jgi:hypothetical protein
MAAADEGDKLEQYPNTILEFYLEPPVRVDLRRRTDPASLRPLAGAGLVGPFAVMTAENPHGESAEDEPDAREARREAVRNARRTGALVDELTRRGTRFVAVDGVSPDGDHRERCVAVSLPRDEAVTTARRFAQLALFWYDGDRFWLLPAEADAQPRPLPAGTP